jgi:hypothetical protein
VLKPDGFAVHIVPSGIWRFWTSITHYPFCVKTAVRKCIALTGTGGIDPGQKTIRKKDFTAASLLRQALFPPRHGETGNALSEMYRFSKKRWQRHFEKTGWKIERYAVNRLFYTGNCLLDTALSLKSRKLLSSILGSACHLFVLKQE